MNAYLGIKFHADNRNRVDIDSISGVLNRCGFEAICVQRDVERWSAVQFAPDELMARTFDRIKRCQLVVIELSEKGVGLGIEAGYAYAQGIPIVVAARHGRDVSATLRGIADEVCFYDVASELEPVFERYASICRLYD